MALPVENLVGVDVATICGDCVVPSDKTQHHTRVGALPPAPPPPPPPPSRRHHCHGRSRPLPPPPGQPFTEAAMYVDSRQRSSYLPARCDHVAGTGAAILAGSQQGMQFKCRPNTSSVMEGQTEVGEGAVHRRGGGGRGRFVRPEMHLFRSLSAS